MDENTQTQNSTQDNQQQGNANLNVIVSAVIALATMALGVYLFKVGQGTVGGTLLGLVVTHYFYQAHSGAATSSTLQTLATVSNLVRPAQPAPQPPVILTQPAPVQPLQAGVPQNNVAG